MAFESGLCKGRKRNGGRCGGFAMANGYCWQHGGEREPEPEPPEPVSIDYSRYELADLRDDGAPPPKYRTGDDNPMVRENRERDGDDPFARFAREIAAYPNGLPEPPQPK